MKAKIKTQIQQGFILFITLIMLIIFAIVGISLYQQTTMATLNVQYVVFKQEAEDLAMKALNELERDIKNHPIDKVRPVCDAKDPGGIVNNCDPISDKDINDALTFLRFGDGLEGGSSNLDGWFKLTEDGVDSFSDNGDVYYIIQRLGKDSENIGYLLYRITIIARVLDTYNVISAVTAVPEEDYDDED